MSRVTIHTARHDIAGQEETIYKLSVDCMKVLIVIALVIVFISSFFIFFIFDRLIRNYSECLSGTCPVGQSSMLFIFGLTAIGVFILISSGAVYIVVTTLKTSPTPPS